MRCLIILLSVIGCGLSAVHPKAFEQLGHDFGLFCEGLCPKIQTQCYMIVPQMTELQQLVKDGGTVSILGEIPLRLFCFTPTNTDVVFILNKDDVTDEYFGFHIRVENVMKQYNYLIFKFIQFLISNQYESNLVQTILDGFEFDSNRMSSLGCLEHNQMPFLI